MSLTPEELAMLGGSDLSALVGLNKHRSPFDIYRRVVDGVETPDNKLMRRGRLMEPVVRTLAAEDLGLKLLGPRKVKDAQRPWLRLSLDDVHQGPEGEEPVEYKSVAFYAAQQYGEGLDEVPVEHICQAQAYLHGLRAPRARLVALIGLDDLREYVLRADLELQSMLLEAAERFWVDHVIRRVPPKPDASPACADWLAARFPKETSPLLEATPDAERWAKQLREARAVLDEWEAKKSEAINNLKAFCGDAAGIVGRSWRVSWKRNKDGVSTDWEAIAKEAGAPEDIVRKHTAPRAGPRVFRPTFDRSDP